MTDTSDTGLSRLSGRQRLWIAALGLGLLVPLGVAGRLEPDPRDHGTHQQLGLPPCSYFAVFGRRCPTCGMTTAWAYLVRGRVPAAFRASVGGALAAVLALAAVPWLLASAFRGRWLGWVPDSMRVAWVLAAVCAVTLIDWVVRIWTG